MKVTSVEFVKSVGADLVYPARRLPEIVFAGRSNVGKSSLLNRLAGRKKIARISSTPGKTTEINYYLVNDTFYFVDLPGYGYARRSKKQRAEWGRAIETYLEESGYLRLLVQLISHAVG